jgi:hypothetical protein
VGVGVKDCIWKDAGSISSSTVAINPDRPEAGIAAAHMSSLGW